MNTAWRVSQEDIIVFFFPQERETKPVKAAAAAAVCRVDVHSVQRRTSHSAPHSPFCWPRSCEHSEVTLTPFIEYMTATNRHAYTDTHTHAVENVQIGIESHVCAICQKLLVLI